MVPNAPSDLSMHSRCDRKTPFAFEPTSSPLLCPVLGHAGVAALAPSCAALQTVQLDWNAVWGLGRVALPDKDAPHIHAGPSPRCHPAVLLHGLCISDQKGSALQRMCP